MTEVLTSPRRPEPTGLLLRTVSDPEELFALGAEWDELVRSGRRASPFLLQGWIGPWWRHFGAGRRLAVEAAWRDGRLVAALPLFVERRFGLRVARFLGGEHTQVADLLLAPGEDVATARALAGRVDVDLLHLFGLPAEGNLHAAVAPEPVRMFPRAEAPFVRFDAPWEELYEKKLSSRRRANRRKALRDLGTQGAVAQAFVTDPDELAAALEEAFAVYEHRWAGLPNHSGFVTPEGKAFHREAVRELAERGAAAMATLRCDGTLVAFNLGLRVGRRACGLTTAYEPSFARFSPGFEAWIHLFEEMARGGVEELELLGSTESYKMTIADGLAPLHEAFIRPRGLRARAFVEARMRALEARARLKRSERFRRFYYEGLAPLRRLRSR